LETAAKLLKSPEGILSLFSKCALKSLNNQADFDSAIRRFNPSRPSQSQHTDFVKQAAVPDPEFPAHLEIQLSPHLEILCWFRFGGRPDGRRRGLNAAQHQIRIERVNAICELQAFDRCR
jgi:hypothetical protein